MLTAESLGAMRNPRTNRSESHTAFASRFARLRAAVQDQPEARAVSRPRPAQSPQQCFASLNPRKRPNPAPEVHGLAIRCSGFQEGDPPTTLRMPAGDRPRPRADILLCPELQVRLAAGFSRSTKKRGPGKCRSLGSKFESGATARAHRTEIVRSDYFLGERHLAFRGREGRTSPPKHLWITCGCLLKDQLELTSAAIGTGSRS